MSEENVANTKTHKWGYNSDKLGQTKRNGEKFEALSSM